MSTDGTGISAQQMKFALPASGVERIGNADLDGLRVTGLCPMNGTQGAGIVERLAAQLGQSQIDLKIGEEPPAPGFDRGFNGPQPS